MIKCLGTFIVVQNTFELIHCWPGAPDDVFYLRQPHRHMMYVYTQIEVKHNDRDLEFIQVKHAIDYFLHSTHFEARVSCEEIAHKVANFIYERFGTRTIIVKVMEDNENGAIVTYDKEDFEHEEN